MSWAGKAAEAAWQVLGYGRGFSEGERRSGFNTGARWQREQLRTDESVERVARALVGVAFCAEEPNELEKLKDSRWDAFEEDARAAITALLEED